MNSKFRKLAKELGGTPVKLEKKFPSNEGVLKKFYKKNKLSRPETLETTRGLIANFKDRSQIIIYHEGDAFPHSEFLVGGSGFVDAQRITYTLEGRLDKKDVRLKTEVCYSNGEKYVSRKDQNKDYWFLDD